MACPLKACGALRIYKTPNFDHFGCKIGYIYNKSLKIRLYCEEVEIDAFFKDVRAKGSKLPDVEIEKYVPTSQI